ncbi:MAG: PDDEXK nuclease domain-containing protein [Candidatus Methanoperedens sp.]|nr:PDDEXK nuclease domain-containing protein [Candidatus Methanoperedens sp.]
MIRTDKNLIDTTNPSVDVTYQSIREILEKARSTAYRTINYAMVQAYWQVGKVIVEEEQNGKEKAGYGEALIKELSKKLTKEYGRGLNERNLWHIRNFYLIFPKVNALRSELSWTHYRLLLRVENDDARHFYIIESIDNNWSTRELERQINSLLFERIALSKNKERVKELSTKGHVIQKPEDIIKDPYVLEFLNLRESKDFMEIDLEQGLIEKLQEFLLELGKGFAFVARQKRITIDGDHFYIDLVFYNYLLRCFLLIDLKIGKLTHKDIGQMDFYVRYFEHEVKQESDSPTIGLILCSDKNEAMVKYTLLENSQRIFASKYKLYLPSEEELKEELEREKQFLELELKEKRGTKLLGGVE